MKPYIYVLVFMLPVAVVVGTHVGGDAKERQCVSAHPHPTDKGTNQESDAFARRLQAELEEKRKADERAVDTFKQRVNEEQVLRGVFERKRLRMRAKLDAAIERLRDDFSREAEDSFTETYEEYVVLLQNEAERREPFDAWYQGIEHQLEVLGLLKK